MSPEQRRYIFVQSAIGSAVVNGLVNGALGWAATRGLTEFPVWKLPGVAPDVVATAFGVAFGTCLGTVLQIRIDLSKSKITPPTELSPFLTALMARRPASLFKRAVLVGILAVPVFAPLILAVLAASGFTAMDRGSFIALKTGLATIEGAALTPFLVLAGLLDTVNARPSS